MIRRFAAFDVETPNRANDRISAIGITLLEEGEIAGEWYSLVNPQAPFDPFNRELTGITPEMVADKPAFPQLWREIRPLLDSGVLAAHNAPFDLSVLAKCLRAYGIAWRDRVPYVCTCQISRRLMPGLPNHRLNTLCGSLGIGLEHHHAGSDSRACGEILRRHLASGADLAPFVRSYDMRGICTAGGTR